MRRFVVFGLALTGVLLAASASQSRPVAVAARADIVGGPSSWTMTLTNTGSPEALRCMRFIAPPGISISNVSGPPGTNLEGSTRFSNASINVPPGGSITFTFVTSGTLTAAVPPTVNVSGDCIGDVPAQVNVTIPTTPPPPPPPPPPPCKCQSFETKLVPKAIAFVNPGDTTGMEMQMTFAWTMICTTGSGNCTGQFDLLPPQPALKLKTRFKPISGRINCVGPCAQVTNGTAKMTLFGGPKFAFGARGKKTKSMQITVRRTCQGQKLAPRKLTIVFSKIGLVDKKKSDWNGDGKPG